MKNLVRIIMLFIVALSSSEFFAQTKSSVPYTSSKAVKIEQDTTLADTVTPDTCYHPLRLISDSVLNLNRAYNQNAYKFRYNSFKERMKKPWIADALREILTLKR